MSYPLVSIPITTYKSQPEHLKQAIESALHQTWPNIEIIVADDSPDSTLEVTVKSFHNSRIKYWHNHPSLGVAKNYWTCFQKVEGDFIAILNHDDLFSPEFVERLVSPLIADSHLALAFCDHWIIDTDGNKLEAVTLQNSRQWGRSEMHEGTYRPFYNLFAAQTIPMAMGAIFRRSFLPTELPEEAGPAYDLWLTYLLCREDYGAYYVNAKLSSWRIHSNNLTRKGGLDWNLGTAHCWNTALNDRRLTTVHNTIRQKAAIAYFYSALSAWSIGDNQHCFEYGLNSLNIMPSIKGAIACVLPLLPKKLVNSLRS